MNKYEILKELAMKIHKDIMNTDISLGVPEIAIRLPPGYWMQSLRDLSPGDGFGEYHPESNCRYFEICGVKFYNDESMPDWMKH